MSNQDLSNLTPEQVYAQLTPEQRAALARQFQQGLQQSDHPDAQQLSQVAPEEASSEHLAQMHAHAAEHNKGLLGLVMNHPVATAALGAFAIYELDRHLGKR
jgi:CO dehydrogenase/acetyl-CoA synthase beta subunit